MTDNQINTIGEKLKKHFNDIGITQEEAAKRLNVSQANISALLNKKPFGKKLAQKWGEEFGIQPSWLLTGEGGMLKEQNDTISSDRQEQGFLVPLLPISAQGGSLDDFVISVKDSDCEKVISPIKGADFAMTVSGDSMAPEYPSGSQILIKRINQRIFIDWGKVYVLDTCNGSIIKIVTQSEKDECIRCISINPDQRRYAPFDVPFCEINGMYRVLLLMSIK